MDRVGFSSLVFVVSVSLLVACAPAGVATPAPAARETAPAPKAGWEQRWETVLAEAKREGSLSIYTSWGPQIRINMTQAFKEKYGIDVEFTLFGRGAEMSARANAERRAGLFIADIFGIGAPTLSTIMKPEGLLGPIEPLLILPEVLDPKAWHGGKLPLVDKDGQVLSSIGLVHPTLLYNSTLVKEGEITTYRDLLKPQYKGKLTLNDPTVTGAGQAVMAHLGYNLWSEAEAADFLRRLVKEQEIVIQRDNRSHVESVARGKYAIAVAASAPTAIQFIEMGAPVKFAIIKENTRITASAGSHGVPARFAHPNAAAAFMNWLLTREGQTVFGKSFGYPSLRLDVANEGINPVFIPKPGEKYYPETEEFITGPLERWLGLSKKIIEEAAR